MRRSFQPWLLLAAGVISPLLAAAAGTTTSTAPPSTTPISDVSVTVYRAQHNGATSLDLDGLGGFALVTETRTVSIPAGESRLRFEGVADGIEPASAIITGLPTGILEKNHDAHVLTPMELVTATLGRHVWLIRTSRKTGKSQAVAGTVVANNGGVIFKSEAGLEALRCSGLPETFHFDAATSGANAQPTLSVLVRSPTPTAATVRLSYLAHGFDWMANYTATVAPDGKTLDLGAWVTLANSNATSFPQAHTQVVAGRLNRESNEVEPIAEQGPEIVANCWPQGSTSDPSEEPNIPGARPLDGAYDGVMVTAMRKSALDVPMAMMAAPAMLAEAVMVEQEELGDLKLYRVPERTSVSSRQVKQVRLLDRKAVPFELVYDSLLQPFTANETHALDKVLRMRNDTAHHLALPLPSGQVATFYQHNGTPLLVHETPLRDVALDEEFEINVGVAPDLQVHTTLGHRTAGAATQLPLIPGVVDIRSAQMDDVHRVEVTNAKNTPATVELRLGQLRDGSQLVRADHAPFMHNGYQTFRLTVPAEGSTTFRYQTAHTIFTPVPH